ncbi:outer membrane biogenesis lipoprotein LolB [Paenibacillus sp. LBL]|nr:outer membrane biogenesis lipoprotein LolB [Paenibacillus sp. LBL]
MRGNSKVLIIMLLLCLPLLVSCGHSTEKRPNATENPQEDNEPTFKIDSEDVSSITVYSYEVRGKSPLT